MYSFVADKIYYSSLSISLLFTNSQGSDIINQIFLIHVLAVRQVGWCEVHLARLT